jgi:hypothetical protein
MKTRNEERRMSMRDRVRQRAKEHGRRGSNYLKLPTGKEYFSPEEGRNEIDIIPYRVSDKRHPDKVPVGDTWMRRTIWVHGDVGVTGSKYLCPAEMRRGHCPICEDRKRMARDEKVGDEELKALSPRERELFNVIDRTEDKPKIKVWDISYYNFGEVLDKEINEGDVKVAGYSELEGGQTLRVRMAEAAIGKTKFLKADRIDFKDRDEDYDESILDKAVDLDAILVVPSYEELKAAYLEADESGADEDDEVPKKKRRVEEDDDNAEDEDDDAPPKKKRKVVEEEDEEEDEDDEVPKKKRRVEADEDEDDEEDEEDDDELDEAPRKKRKVVDEDDED